MKGQIVSNSRIFNLLFRAICLLTVLLFADGCRPVIQILTPDLTIARRLSAQATHQYKFSIHPKHYSKLILHPAGGRLDGKLYDQQGNILGELYANGNGEVSASVITDTGGDLRLVLHSLETNGAGGGYQLKLTAGRQLQAEDRIRLAAESCYFVAEKLRSEWKEKQTLAALEKYREAASLWNSIHANQEQAQALRRIGKAYLSLGNLELAREYLNEALTLSKQAGDGVGEAEAYVDLGELSISLEDFEKVPDLLDAAVVKGHELGNQHIIARATTNQGLVKGYENLSQSLLLFDKASSYWEEVEDRASLTDLHLKKGIAYFYGGEFKKALASFQLAHELAQQAGNRQAIAFVHVTRGHAFSVLGEKQEALKAYDIARPLLEESGDKFTQASLISGIGFVYDELGDEPKALHFRQKALELYQTLNAQSYISLHQMYVGELHYRQGNYKLALMTLSDALQGFRDLKDRRMEPQAIRDIGQIYAAQGQNQRALSYFKQALSLGEEVGESRWRAYVMDDLGRVFRQLGNLTLSESNYRNALTLNKKVEDQIGASQTLYLLAELERDKGRYNEAKEWVEQSLTIIESLRAKVLSQELRTSYFASVNQIFELSIDILMKQHQLFPASDFARKALTVYEQSRARTLLDLLKESQHGIKQGVGSHLLEQERIFRQSLNGKAERKLQLTNQTDKEAELAAITKEIENLTTQLDDVRSQIRATSPRYAALTQPQPLKAEEIQQLLDDDTLLLEYSLGEERSYLWAVTRHSIEAFTLPKRAVIEPLVHDLLELMTAPAQPVEESAAQWQARLTQAHQDYWPRAAELSQILLGPIAAKLGQQRLLIVGDGALQRLPFAPLPKPNDNGGTRNNERNGIHRSSSIAHPLVADHEITHLPSASSLKLLREDRARAMPPAGWLASWSQSLRAWWNGNDAASQTSVAVLADPVFGLEDKRVKFKEVTAAPTNQTRLRDVDLTNENAYFPRLAATREEAAAIQKAAGTKPVLVKQGFEVNRSLLESEALQSYSILHLATHGYWDSTNPELSAIVLSRVDAQGKQLEDGTLRLSDIYNLNLRKELVVLSACETAVGKDIRGEGLVALTRGFMYAGATRVMASLWKVEDSATAAIMKEFYQHLLQKGLSPAAALRQAQITMWEKHPTEVPYKWAAFVIQGEYR